MAEKLTEFAFRGRGGGARYPWDEWLDGSPWRLTRGDDFAIPTHSMRATAVSAATRRGVKVRTSSPDSDTLVIQAYHPNGAA